MTPPTSDFGTVTINTSSSATNFTVTNSGQETSGSISAIVSGAAASDFTVANSCSTLAGAGTCIVSVTFSPTTAGPKTASLIVSGSPGGTVMATLNGAAVNPGTLTLAPQGNQSFGNVIVGATGTFQTFTVTNSGGVTTGTLTVTPAGSDPNQFTKTNDLCNGMTLAAGANCTFRVNFAPTSTGAKAATFIVAGTPGGSVTATVSGNGVEDANIAGSPTIGGFGTVTIGQSSSDVTFTFTNTGDLPTSALLAPVVAPTPEYSITSQNCTGVVLTANGGNSCTVLVRFTPTAAGNRPGTLTVSATTGGTEVVTLSGTGNTVGSLSVTPNPFAYGNVTVGQTSNNTFTVTNTGGSAAGPLVATVSGEFTIVAGQDACTGVTLAAAGTCTVVVAFAPTSGGAENGTLTVSGGVGSPGSADLSGTGIISAAISSSAPSHDFGSVVLATASAPFTFTITNDGGVASSVPTVAVNGANAAQFAANNMCTAALAPGGSCTVTVTFTPTTVGAKTATLDVSITPGNALSLGLSGDGITNAQIVAAPSALPFNDTFVGDSSQQIFTVTNNGSVTTGPITITETGTNQADFSQTNNCTTLTNGQSCTVTVTFAPTAEGLRTNTFTVTGTPGGTTTVAVSGNGVPRIEVTDPTTNPFDFGTRAITATTPLSCRVVTFVNNTAQNQSFTLAFTNFQNLYPGNPSNGTPDAPTADYFWQPTSGTILGSFQSCDSLTSLPPAGSTILGIATDTCSIEVCFDPNEPGTQTGNVTMTVGAGGPDNQASQDFTGVGTANSLVITPCTGGNCTSAATPSFNYGNVNVGTIVTQMFTLTNQTMAATGTLETDLSGTFTTFHILQDNCAGTTLAVNGTCTVTVSFQPTGAGGSAVNSLTIRDITTLPASQAERQIVGNGIVPAALAGAPSTGTPFDYGTIFLGESSAAAGQSFTITNPTGENSGPITVAVAGNTAFTVQTGAAGDCVSGTTIVGPIAGPNVVTSCVVRVRFAPSATTTVGLHAGTQVQRATLTVTGTPGGTTGSTNNLIGTSQSTISVGPAGANTNFGNVVLGQTADLPFTMTNNSATQTVSFQSGLSPLGEFTVVNVVGCASLAPGATCTFAVRFAPVGATGVRGPTTLTMSATNGVAILSGLTGTAQSVANLVLTPTAGDFGSVLSGTATSQLTFRLTNTGFQSATGVTVSIPNAMGNYSQLNNCPVEPFTLGLNDFCTITVTFAPPLANTGVLNATLTVASTLGGAPTATLTGRGIANGQVTVTPATRNFGAAVTGQQSEQQVFTLLNTSAATVATLMLTPPADFVVDNTGVAPPLCGATLNPVNACNIGVRFAPGSAGVKTAQFAFTAGTYAALQGVGLSNALVTGLAPHDFGVVRVEGSSAPNNRAYTITNGNMGATGPLAVALSGPDAGNFAIVFNSCAGGFDLLPGASCGVTVQFQPQAALGGFGPQMASLDITSNAVGAGGIPANAGISISAALTGTGANVQDISIAPATTQDDGSRAVGALDPAATVFTITNAVGSAPTGALAWPALSDTANFRFSTVGLTNPCLNGSTTLAGGASCQIGVFFHPTSTGMKTANLTITEAGVGDSVAFTVTGTGTEQLTGPAMPTALTANTNTTLTFTNNASVATNPLEVDETSLGSQVSLITNNCVAQVLPAGGSCTVIVRYVPDGLNGPTNALFGVRATVNLTSPPYGTAAPATTAFSFACNHPGSPGYCAFTP